MQNNGSEEGKTQEAMIGYDRWSARQSSGSDENTTQGSGSKGAGAECDATKWRDCDARRWRTQRGAM
eukprot:4629329-Pyramimonas_sp.AAC.1